MSILSLIVAMLSVSGIVIRYKRRGGLFRGWQQHPAPTQAAPQ